MMDDPFLRDTSNKRNDKVHGSITVRVSPQNLKKSLEDLEGEVRLNPYRVL